MDWEEQFISHDRGSRVVHYYLKDRHGQNSLAVIGTERSLRHMVYVVCDDFLPLAGLDKTATSAFKWRARREVVEWLQTLLTKTRSTSSEQYLSSGSPSTEPGASSEVDAVMEETDEALESGQEEKRRGFLVCKSICSCLLLHQHSFWCFSSKLVLLACVLKSCM